MAGAHASSGGHGKSEARTLDAIIAEDPTLKKFDTSLEGAASVARDLQAPLGKYVGQKIDEPLVDKVIHDLYDAPHGKPSVIANVVAKYLGTDVTHMDAQKLNELMVQYGPTRDLLKKAILENGGETFKDSTISLITNQFGSLYHGRTSEPISALIQEDAAKGNMDGAKEKALAMVHYLGGQAREKAERSRVMALKTAQDIGTYVRGVVGDSYATFRQARGNSG